MNSPEIILTLLTYFIFIAGISLFNTHSQSVPYVYPAKHGNEHTATVRNEFMGGKTCVDFPCRFRTEQTISLREGGDT